MAAIFGHECHDGQNDPGIDDDKPAFYAGEANETDILAEGDVRGTVEEGGKGGAEAIANIAAAQLPGPSGDGSPRRRRRRRAADNSIIDAK